MAKEPTDVASSTVNQTVKYLEGLTIHKVPYNIANTSDFKTNVMGKAADNELFIITDTPTFSLKIGNVTYDGTSNVSATTATQSVSGLMSAADKKKLDGIAAGATKITVDTSVSSTSTNPVQNKAIKTELDKKAGTAVATTNTNGLMSAADKTKLNGIATGANKTIVDTALSDSSTNPVQNKVIKTELDKKADNTALDAKADKTALDGKLDKTGGTLTGNLTGKYLTGTWLQTTASTDLGRTPGKVAVLDDSGWVYYRTPAEIKSDIGADAVVTTSSNGLMSASDKSKLDGIAAGATKITVDATFSSTSTNPVQNKIVNGALQEKFSKSGGGISGDVRMDKTLDLKGRLDARETILAYKDVQCLYDNDVRIRIACDSSGAAKITTTDGISYACLKIASPTGNDDATTKNYVDTGLNGKLNKSGGTMTGAITTKGIKLTSGTDFGSSLPSSLQSNQLFFQTLGSNYILDNVYPVGSIYMSVNSTNPTNLFGGTWEQIQGKFLFGMDSSYPAGSTGGEITHKLTWNEMPGHYHEGLYYSYQDTKNLITLNGGTVSYHIPWGSSSYAGDYGAGTGEKELITGTAGSGEAHNNMPPYLSVYIWKRTK